MGLVTRNAIIKGTSILISDHDILSVNLALEYEGGGQGIGSSDLTAFIKGVMEVLEVWNWKDVQGKVIRVMADHEHVEAIGHPIKDKWYYPRG
jgi:hypothetical protein